VGAISADLPKLAEKRAFPAWRWYPPYDNPETPKRCSGAAAIWRASVKAGSRLIPVWSSRSNS